MNPDSNDPDAPPSMVQPEPDMLAERAAFAAKLAAIVNVAPKASDAAKDHKVGTFLTRTFFPGKAKVPSPEAAEPVSRPEGLSTPAPTVEDFYQSAATTELSGPDKPVFATSPVPGSVQGTTPATPTAVADVPPAIPTLRSRVSVVPAAQVGPAGAPTGDTPPTIPATGLPLAPAAMPETASINQSITTMPPDDPLNTPATGRALAQLTFGFEIVSMQLTPFFRLGSVQLKASSDVVSLHLLAARREEHPLAAGISFLVERVELDEAAGLRSILLKPLDEARELTAPTPSLQIDHLSVAAEGEDAPISVKTSGQAATAVQLLGTFAVAALDFTPSFEIGSLRLEPTSRTVRLRVAPSTRPAAVDLPPSFDITAVELGAGARFETVRVVPSVAKPM